METEAVLPKEMRTNSENCGARIISFIQTLHVENHMDDSLEKNMMLQNLIFLYIKHIHDTKFDLQIQHFVFSDYLNCFGVNKSFGINAMGSCIM